MNRTIASATADLDRNQREYRDKLITAQTEVQEAEAALELARAQMKQYLSINTINVRSNKLIVTPLKSCNHYR